MRGAGQAVGALATAEARLANSALVVRGGSAHRRAGSRRRTPQLWGLCRKQPVDCFPLQYPIRFPPL